MNKEADILEKIIKSRRSIFPKDFVQTPIPEDVLARIIESTDYAPNHKKTRPWRCRIFKETEKAELGAKLAQVYLTTTPPERFLEKKFNDISAKILLADTIVVICVKFSGLIPEWEEIAATAMAVQNMYLMSTANKVGCYWSTPAMKDHLSEFLNLEENERCLGLFYMGMLA